MRGLAGPSLPRTDKAASLHQVRGFFREEVRMRRRDPVWPGFSGECVGGLPGQRSHDGVHGIALPSVAVGKYT